jgi:integrase
MEAIMNLLEHSPDTRIPWNKGKLVGQKPPLKLREIWAIRIRLQLAQRTRDLALFNLAIDSKLRACDLVHIRVRDIAQGGQVARRAIILQRKTQRPVRFEIADQAREAIQRWLDQANLKSSQYLFPSQARKGSPITTRQYARSLRRWITDIGLNPLDYGTHSLRRTKATLIYRRTKNLRAVQLLLGHSKLESTVRYLGIEAEDALEMAERTDV